MLNAIAMRGFGQGDRHVFERNRTRIDDFDFDEFMRVERRLELFDDLRRWTAMPDVDDGFEIVSEPAQLAAASSRAVILVIFMDLFPSHNKKYRYIFKTTTVLYQILW